MKTVAGIRFKKPGKIYFFDPGELHIEEGMHVIVDTAMGEEYGEVVIASKEVEDSEISEPLKKILRVSSHKDEKIFSELKVKEPEALRICEEKVKKHGLEMKLIDCEYKFDGSKLIFYFTADGRIDFRELVKDLAAIFRTRIELRQIGVRDKSKVVGGYGQCGRELCCKGFLKEFNSVSSFLVNFATVSIKMAKEQNISLNPSKISGRCGRLMCCLNYEEEVYEEKLKRMPKIGAIVKTEDGTGEVVSIETLKEIVRVKFEDGEDSFFKKYEAKDIEIIKDVEESDDAMSVVSEEERRELEELEKLEKSESNDNNDNI